MIVRLKEICWDYCDRLTSFWERGPMIFEMAESTFIWQLF